MKITVEFDSLEELLELQVLVDAARAVKTAKADPVEAERKWYFFDEIPPPARGSFWAMPTLRSQK